MNIVKNIFDFCRARSTPATSIHETKDDLLMRYIQFCLFHGKVAIAFQDGKIETLVFWWPDTLVNIQEKHATGKPQFEWVPTKRGDCLFLSDLIGNMKGVKKITKALMSKWPAMANVPVYTYRHGRLMQVPPRGIERVHASA